MNGKTVAESFPSPSAWRKAQSEIDEYHRLRKLSTELIAINEKICKHRPLESESNSWTPEEKQTLLRSIEEITREIDQWLRVLFSGRRKTGHVDMEAIEMGMRLAMHRVAAAGTTELLQFPVPPAEQRTLPCSCGHAAHYRELRSKPVLT